MTEAVIRFRAHRARTRPLAWAVSALAAAVRDWRVRRLAAADLRALNDGLLADLGIGPGDIPTVVDGLMAAARGRSSGRGVGGRSGEERTAMAA